MDLAAEGAEAEGVEEAPLADLAGVGDSLAGPRLGTLVQEHHAGAVDDVRLHAGDVQHLLDLGNANHVVVGRSPYLHHRITGHQTGNQSRRFLSSGRERLAVAIDRR